MDLRQLRTFVEVVDRGSFSAAADALGVTQPAVSQQIRSLERAIGTPLVDRGGRQATATPRGEVVYRHALRLLAARADLERELAEGHDELSGPLLVGASTGPGEHVLPALMGRFRRANPRVAVSLRVETTSTVIDRVLGRELELGVVTLPVPSRELDVDELCTDEIVLVARPDHPLASGCSVADLEGRAVVAFEPMSAIRQIIDASLREAGVQVEVVMELRSIPSILQMVAMSGTVAFVSRLSLQSEPSLVEVPVEGLSIARTLAVVTRRAVPLAPPAAAFVALLMSRIAGRS